MVSTIREMLRAARKDTHIKALILDIDSPGGGITASDVLRHELADFQEQTGVPIICLLGDVAASGGYYVASASQYIVAHPTTVTGSIGVIMPLLGIQDLLSKIGVESRPIKSAKLKDMASSFRAMSEQERKMLQDMVDEYHRKFVSVVADGFRLRQVQISRKELDKYCDGRVFSGKQALKLGFVDEVGYMEDALAAAYRKGNIQPSASRVITYYQQPGLLGLILARMSAPQPETLTVRLEGLTTADTPRFLYLWTIGQPRLQQSAGR